VLKAACTGTSANRAVSAGIDAHWYGSPVAWSDVAATQNGYPAGNIFCEQVNLLFSLLQVVLLRFKGKGKPP
jgi:hypothetical protein